MCLFEEGISLRSCFKRREYNLLFGKWKSNSDFGNINSRMKLRTKSKIPLKSSNFETRSLRFQLVNRCPVFPSFRTIISPLISICSSPPPPPSRFLSLYLSLFLRAFYLLFLIWFLLYIIFCYIHGSMNLTNQGWVIL